MKDHSQGVSENTIREWRTYFEKRKNEGASRWKVAGELEGPLSKHMIYLYLDENSLERARTSSRANQYRARQKEKFEKERLRKSSQVRRALHRGEVQEYERWYRRLTRNPEIWIPNLIYEDRAQASVDEIHAELENVLQYSKLRRSTVEAILQACSTKQVERGMVPRLHEQPVGSGIWRYDAISDEACGGNPHAAL